MYWPGVICKKLGKIVSNDVKKLASPSQLAVGHQQATLYNFFSRESKDNTILQNMKRGIFTRQLPRILLLCLVPFLLLLSLVLRLLMSLRFVRRLIVISGFFPCLVMSSSFFPRLGISSKFVRPNSAPLYKFGVEIARWGLTGTRHEKAIIYVGLETGITTQQRIDNSLQGRGKFKNRSAHPRRIRGRSRNRTRTMTSYSCRTAS